MSDNYSPLVSIITPTYNQEKFIGPCIESVLQQTYQNWEQIVIDDGSTDRTAGVIRRYADPRIRYYHQENTGIDALAATYNRALSFARGDLVAILEGDDFWPLDKLTALVPKLIDSNVVLGYGNVVDVHANGQQQSGTSRTARRRQALPTAIKFNDPVPSATHYMLQAEGCSLVPSCTALIRREALERIGGFQHFPGFPAIDLPTFLRLTLEGKFHYEDAIMGFHRRHLNSVTVSEIERMYTHAVQICATFLKEHRDRLQLSDADVEKVNGSWRTARSAASFNMGQFLLARDRWQEARTYFRTALVSGQPVIRLASLLGWVFSWLHVDMEPLMRLAGRASLR